MAIHDGHRERMRKQLKTSGMDSLSDVQVLEVLLYYAAPRGDTNPAAHSLLNRFGTLDGCLPEFVLAALREATDDSMTRDEMLRAMYLYVRDSFTYLRRHYYKTGDVGWATQEALTMYSTGRGNCYCFASAFWAAARALGFDAKIVSGTYGEEEAPHGWVEILRGGERYTYDVEIEMAVRRDRGASDLYEMDDSARRRHGYQEFSATDDMLPRSLAGELLPG